MIWTQQLYDIEDRAQGMSADDRRALRQAEALPILARMKARFEEVRPTLRPTSKLAEAIDYVLNRWDAFVRYTSDGRIPIDNNVIERLLRPVAIGRKNYLFFGSEHGGQTAATLYTLVQSARRNCVDVWPYLNAHALWCREQVGPAAGPRRQSSGRLQRPGPGLLLR
jgi:hypothetical protein